MDVKDFEDMTQAEAKKFMAWFNNEYSVLYKDRLPVLGKNVALDWKFWAILGTSVATILVAALRTAQMFFFVEKLSSAAWGVAEDAGGQTFAVASAFFVLFAIEGGLAVIGAIQSSSKDEIEEWKYSLQVGILLTISIFAGIGNGLGLIPGISEAARENFSIGLILVMGIGMSVASWISGEIVGLQIRRADLANLAVLKKFDDDTKAFAQSARKFWKDRTERERAEQAELQKQNKANRPEAVLTEKQQAIFETFELFRNRNIEEGKEELPGVTEVLTFLLENDKYKHLGFTPTGKGYISDQRKVWVARNPQYFEEKEN